MTSADIKVKIAEWCRLNLPVIDRQFVYASADEQQEVHRAAQTPAAWKRMWKRKEGDGVERAFNCAPLDDQLRAYVYTDDADSTVLSIHVQGE